MKPMTSRRIWPGLGRSEFATVKKVPKSEVGMRVKSLNGLGYSDLGFLIKLAQSNFCIPGIILFNTVFHRRVGYARVS